MPRSLKRWHSYVTAPAPIVVTKNKEELYIYTQADLVEAWAQNILFPLANISPSPKCLITARKLWSWRCRSLLMFCWADVKHILTGSWFSCCLTSDLLCVCLPLQRQVAGEVQTQPQDRAVNQIAMMLAIIGLGLSYYSAKQMTEKAQPAPWRDSTSPIVGKIWMSHWEVKELDWEGGSVVRPALFSPHSHNHTRTMNFWGSITHHVKRFQGCF